MPETLEGLFSFWSFEQGQQAFVASADLTDYDLSGAKLVRFELKRKDKSINLRLPEQLLDAVRSRAEKERIPYQRFIRLALEQAIGGPQ